MHHRKDIKANLAYSNLKLKKCKAAKPLFESLNPITKYKLAGAVIVLSTAEKWNIL